MKRLGREVCTCAHTHVCSLYLLLWLPGPRHGQSPRSGRLEGNAEQQISCCCFSALGNCLHFSLSKQNASFFPVGTTFPSPLGGLFMQVLSTLW